MFLALLRDLLKHCDIVDLSEPLYLYVLIYYIKLSWNIEASFWSLKTKMEVLLTNIICVRASFSSFAMKDRVLIYLRSY